MEINEFLAGAMSGSLMFFYVIISSAFLKSFITDIKILKLVSLLSSFIFVGLIFIEFGFEMIDIFYDTKPTLYGHIKFYFAFLTTSVVSISLGFIVYFDKIISNKAIKKDV